MKNFCFLAIMLLSTVTITFGQRGHYGKQGQDLSQLKSDLNLSEEQFTNLEKLQLDSRAEMKALKENTTLSQEEKKAKMMELRSNQKAAHDAILTEEQKTKLKTLRAEKQKLHKAEMAEMKETHKAKKAELKTLRAEFDSKISTVDKEKIENLRVVFQNAKKEMHSNFKGQKGQKGQRPSKEEMKAKRDEMKAHKEKFRADHESELAELKSLNEKYGDEIKSFLEEKGFNPDHDKLNKNKGNKTEKTSKTGGRKGNGNRNLKHGDNVHGFLLMDFTNDSNTDTKISDAAVKIFPNPSNGLTNVTYEVRSKGNVTVQIKDESGKVIKTLVNETAEKGNYNLEVNTIELRNNNYFIVVTDAQGITSKKLVVIK